MMEKFKTNGGMRAGGISIMLPVITLLVLLLRTSLATELDLVEGVEKKAHHQATLNSIESASQADTGNIARDIGDVGVPKEAKVDKGNIFTGEIGLDPGVQKSEELKSTDSQAKLDVALGEALPGKRVSLKLIEEDYRKLPKALVRNLFSRPHYWLIPLVIYAWKMRSDLLEVACNQPGQPPDHLGDLWFKAITFLGASFATLASLFVLAYKLD